MEDGLHHLRRSEVKEMDKKAYLNALQQSWSSCGACSLCQSRQNIVFGMGNPNAQIMIIGEAPGQREDELAVPFVGAAGNLLDSYLAEVSCREEVIQAGALTKKKDLKEEEKNALFYELRNLLMPEYYYANIVMCRPSENRDPLPKEIAACRPRLLEQIYIVDPVLIIAAGRVAAEAIIGKKISITQQRGELFDIEFQGRGTTYRYTVMVVLHPAYLLRKNDFRQVGGDGVKTYNDFLRAVSIIDEYNLRHFGVPKPTNRPSMEK